MQTGKEYAMKKAMFLFVFSLSALCLAAQSPEWQWAKQAGGASLDYSGGIATDNSGNSYVSGWFENTATFGGATLSSNGDYDIYIAKLDANGNWLWATQAGGVNEDRAFGIGIDSYGNSYVTGVFRGDTHFGDSTLTSSGLYDIFIAKLDPDGNWLWGTRAGGTDFDIGNDISVDSSGNSYVTGYFDDDATFGSTPLSSLGNKDLFICKLDTNGNWLWAKQAGGAGDDIGYGIATNSDGYCYLTGVFFGTATFGTNVITSSGSGDIFITKLDLDGNWLWAWEAGGGGFDTAYSIATDSSGSSYVTGCFYGNATFGTTLLYNSGHDDIFVNKLDTNGNFLWAVKAGGANEDVGCCIATDSCGNSIISGVFSGTASFGSTYLSSSGSEDIFIAKLDTNGNYLWAEHTGGSSSDRGLDIAMDSSGISYVTGVFTGTVTYDNTTLTSSGEYDIFIAKLSNTTGVSDEYEAPQAHFSLGQNRPNPFTATTSFSLEVSNAKDVYEVSVYDLRGRQISTLHRGVLPVGERSFTWNGKDHLGNQLASGLYFYRVTNGLSSQVKKMIYVR